MNNQAVFNRQANGRFGSGNCANPSGRNGKEFYQKAQQLVMQLHEKSFEQWQDFTDALFKHAIAGNMSAARIICDYALGRPTDKISISNESPDDYSLELPTKAAREQAELIFEKALEEVQKLAHIKS
jgi:hypothetical protein